MTDRPIIFSGPMVQALLAGRKSQTRRVLKPQPFPFGGPFYRPFEKTDPCLWYSISAAGTVANIQKVPYAPGDRLYVREAHKLIDRHCDYRADWPEATQHLFLWRPSIHMPRWASRITLTVTEVRVQRLQEISAADSIAEGVECETCSAMGQSACHGRGCFASTDAYRTLWNSLHGPDAWDANPWVVAVSFIPHLTNIDAPYLEMTDTAGNFMARNIPAGMTGKAPCPVITAAA